MNKSIATWKERYALGLSTINDSQMAEIRDLRAYISELEAENAVHFTRCDEMRDALCECKTKLQAELEARTPAVAGSVDTPEFRKLLLSVRDAKHALAISARTELLIDYLNARLAPAAPSGEAVAWYDPTNKNPGQSVTFDRAKRDGWPHMHPVALFPHPAPSEIEAAELREAAQAVVDRWLTPKWKDEPHTAVFIDRLSAALKGNK